MPQLGNFFIDATTLAGATAVFQNAALTVVAADGYYSDGSIVRLQTNGVLGAPTPCPNCSLPCNISVTANGSQGLYQTTFQAGQSSGCLIIYFNPGNVPDGFQVEYDSNEATLLTSENFGVLKTNVIASTRYNFVGNTANDCAIAATLTAGGYSGLAQNVYTGNQFVSAGNNGTVTGDATDVNLTNGNPGWCTHFFPYTPAVNAFIVNIASVCNIAATWTIEANCPVLLTGVPTGPEGVNCGDNFPDTLYNVPNRNGTAGEPALHEFMCTDQNGEFFPASGTYTINPPSGKKQITLLNDATTSFQAIITNIVACPP